MALLLLALVERKALAAARRQDHGMSGELNPSAHQITRHDAAGSSLYHHQIQHLTLGNIFTVPAAISLASAR